MLLHSKLSCQVVHTDNILMLLDAERYIWQVQTLLLNLGKEAIHVKQNNYFLHHQFLPSALWCIHSYFILIKHFNIFMGVDFTDFQLQIQNSIPKNRGSFF